MRASSAASSHRRRDLEGSMALGAKSGAANLRESRSFGQGSCARIEPQ